LDAVGLRPGIEGLLDAVAMEVNEPLGRVPQALERLGQGDPGGGFELAFGGVDVLVQPQAIIASPTFFMASAAAWTFWMPPCTRLPTRLPTSAVTRMPTSRSS